MSEEYADFARKFRKQRRGQPGRFAQLISYLISKNQHRASVRELKDYLGCHNRQRFWQIINRARGWLVVEKRDARFAEAIALNQQAIEFINKVVDFDE